MSDGPGSHCEMMSENPRQINIVTPHVTANVSVAPVDVPYPNDFTYMLKNFQSVGCCGVFHNKVVALNIWNFAVFDGALDTFARLSLCFAFDA